MRITSDKMEISSSEEIAWKNVKRLRLINEKLALVLTNNKVVEFEDLRPSQIDLAFKSYEKYIREHPVKPKKRAAPKRRRKGSD